MRFVKLAILTVSVVLLSAASGYAQEVVVAGPAGQDTQSVDPALAPDILAAAKDACKNNDTDTAIRLIRVLRDDCKGTKEAIIGLTLMAEMAVRQCIAATYQTEAYNGLLEIKGTSWLDEREKSLNVTGNLDAGNGWKLNWQYIKDRVANGEKKGRPFVHLVVSARNVSGNAAVWPLLDTLLADANLNSVWQVSVEGLIDTVQKQDGVSAAVTTALKIAEKYPGHSGGIAAMWEGWRILGVAQGEVAQIAYLQKLAKSSIDSRVRTRAMYRLSDHMIRRNDVAAATAAYIPAATGDTLFAQPLASIDKAAGLLSAHLKEVKAKIAWSGITSKADILLKLADIAESRGLVTVAVSLRQDAGAILAAPYITSWSQNQCLIQSVILLIP